MASYRAHLAWYFLLGLGAAFGNLAQKTPKDEELILNAFLIGLSNCLSIPTGFEEANQTVWLTVQ